MSERGNGQRYQSLGTAIGAGAALLVVGALVVGSALQPEPDTRGDLRAALFAPGESPLAGGRRATLEQAITEFPATVVLPEAELASDSSIDQIWMRVEPSPQLYIEYRSGIVVTLRPKFAGLPTKEYAEAQIVDGVPGVLVDVGNGVEAFEVPQSDEGDLGSERMVLDTVIVVVIGHGDFGRSALREVARSIAAADARSL